MEKWNFRSVKQIAINSSDELDEKERNFWMKVMLQSTLKELIGGQISSGFLINGFYEDIDSDLICDYSSKYFATRAIKL